MSPTAEDSVETIELEDLRPGMVLARDVTHPDTDDVLLRKGATLSQSDIQSMKDQRILSLPIDPKSLETAEDDGEVTFDDRELERLADEVLDEHKQTQQEKREELRQFHRQSLSTAEEQLTDLDRRGRLDVAEVRQLVEQWYRFLHEEPEESIKLTRVRSDQHYLYSHCLNVTILGMYLGIQLGLERRELRELGVGALIHDVGMFRVPDEILHKESSLNDDEYAEVQRHTETVMDELSSISNLSYLARMVVHQHHERLDGSGYPRGIEGEQISRFARIIAVVDSYDAMISPRKYRQRISSYQAMQNILQRSGKTYWKPAANQFFQSMAVYPIGTVVELDNGAVGIVQKTTDSPMRPELKVIVDSDGNRLDQPRPLSLLENRNLFVSRVLEEIEV